jgi:hypothetical protein
VRPSLWKSSVFVGREGRKKKEINADLGLDMAEQRLSSSSSSSYIFCFEHFQ